MIGFGSIGKGTLPLIELHFAYDKSRFVIIDPHEDGEIAKVHGVRFIKQAITRDNYREVLVPLLTSGGGQGFCVNLSVDTSSVDIMSMCREIGALYIDTVVEPWLGFYFDKNIGPEKRSNYALRESLLAAKHKSPGGTTAVSTCGANPGMVSWFVKQALLDIARDTNTPFNEPKGREGWGPQARRQRHPYRRTRHSAFQETKDDEGVRQHVVGGGVRLGGHATGRTRLGHAREVDARQWPRARLRLRGGDLSAAARSQYARPLMVSDTGTAIRLSGHAQ